MQRKVYLAEPDLALYKDEDHEDLHLAYLEDKGWGRGSLPIFADHAKVKARKKEAERRWKKLPRQSRALHPSIGYWVQHIRYADQQPDLGPMWIEEDRTLYEYTPDAGERARRLAAVVDKGRLLYRETTGGARLPRPEGVIFLPPGWRDPETEPNEALEDLLEVKPGLKRKLEEVTFEELSSPTKYRRTRQQRKDDPEANIFPLDLETKSLLYSSTVEPKLKPNIDKPVQVDGRRHDRDFTAFDTEEKRRRLHSSFRNLPTPTDSGWVDGTQLSKEDREGGQTQAMNDWNAYGAAAYAKRFLDKDYDLTRHWEWLHIQGAQIGGATRGGNLVPGLFATNSTMTAYEKLIAEWARAGATATRARFRPDELDGVFAGKIVIEVHLDQTHPLRPTSLGSFDDSVTFRPTEGRVVDRLASEILTFDWRTWQLPSRSGRSARTSGSSSYRGRKRKSVPRAGTSYDEGPGSKRTRHER